MLDLNVLTIQLENIQSSNDYQVAINNFVNALIVYLQGASLSGIIANPNSIKSIALNTMPIAMSPLWQTDAASAIQAGLIAFWLTLVTLAPTIWIVPPFVVGSVTPPPGITSLAPLLKTVFLSNSAAKYTNSNMPCQNIATIINTVCQGAIALLISPSGVSSPTPIV